MDLKKGLQVPQSVIDRRLDYEEASFQEWVYRFLAQDDQALREAQTALRDMDWVNRLIEVPVVFRLHGLTQWGVKARASLRVRKAGTLQGYVIDEVGAAHHDRFTHSVQVAAAAFCLSIWLKLDQRSRNTLLLAAFLHDIGHSPYAHDGDRIVRSFGGRSHEEVGQDLVLKDSYLKRVCKEAGVRPSQVRHVMREEGVLGRILSLADTTGYVGMDLRMAGAEYAPRATAQILQSVTGVHRRGLRVHSKEPIRRLLDDRAELGREVYYTGRACAMAEATHILWSEVFRQGLLSVADFMRMTDFEANACLEALWPKLCEQDPGLIPVRVLSLGVWDPLSWGSVRMAGASEAKRYVTEARSRGIWAFAIKPMLVGAKSYDVYAPRVGVVPVQATSPSERAPYNEWRVWIPR